MSKMLAPCGIDCQICDAYIATQNNDIQIKQKMADGYKQHFNKEMPIGYYDCDGCPSEGKKIGFCDTCGIRICAYGKGFATCAECSEFPCETGSFIWTKNSVSKANLEAIRN